MVAVIDRESRSKFPVLAASSSLGNLQQLLQVQRSRRSDREAGLRLDTAESVAIKVRFNGKIYEGTTDDRGAFRATWETGLSSGSHYANVDSLMLSGYDWTPLALDLEDDSDGDGVPDDLLTIS